MLWLTCLIKYPPPRQSQLVTTINIKLHSDHRLHANKILMLVLIPNHSVPKFDMIRLVHTTCHPSSPDNPQPSFISTTPKQLWARRVQIDAGGPPNVCLFIRLDWTWILCFVWHIAAVTKMTWNRQNIQKQFNVDRGVPPNRSQCILIFVIVPGRKTGHGYRMHGNRPTKIAGAEMCRDSTRCFCMLKRWMMSNQAKLIGIWRRNHIRGRLILVWGY